MKPVLIFKELKDGKVELTKEELEKLLEDAYNEGYNAGKAVNITYPVYPTSPDVQPITTPTYPWYPVWYCLSDFNSTDSSKNKSNLKTVLCS